MKVKYAVLGGGCAALGFCWELKHRDCNDFVILEREETAGGLCRSIDFDGGPLDIGGGHILDVSRPRVNNLLFSYLPENEWNLFERNSKIRFGNYEIKYPFESHIWQLPEEMQIEFLESIAQAGCIQGTPMPEKYPDWILWKLGGKIAENYMLPYNNKIFSCDLNELGTYWLYKLPNVSFREVLLSCLRHSLQGKLPCHAHFYYPKKYGYGEVFLRMAEDMKENIMCSTPVKTVDWERHVVNGDIEAEYIINTVPWCEFSSSLPESIQERINGLKFTSVDVDYYHTGEEKTDAHWTYCSNPEFPFHRLNHRNNFALGSRGFWTETNAKRAVAPKSGQYQPNYGKLLDGTYETTFGEYHNRIQYAYPLSTIDKPKRIADVLAWGKQHNIIGLGRWGEWEHMNSDVAILKGLELADLLENETR